MFVFVPRSRPAIVGSADDRAYALEMARAGLGPDEVETMLRARGLDTETARGIVRTIGAWRRYGLNRLAPFLAPLLGILVAIAFSVGRGELAGWLARARRDGHGVDWSTLIRLSLALLTLAVLLRGMRRRSRGR